MAARDKIEAEYDKGFAEGRNDIRRLMEISDKVNASMRERTEAAKGEAAGKLTARG